jgi:pimeloyl-ACP methyl ester carboxylesterase
VCAAQLASDLASLLDHLGIDSTAVLGYSQGAQHLGQERGDWLAGLMLINLLKICR